MMPPWLRPRFRPSERRARLGFFGFLKGPRIEDALARARDQVPDPAAWDALEIAVRSRGVDQGRLAEALAGRAGWQLELRAHHERHEAERCSRYVAIETVLPDPPTLSVLQAALAVLCALAVEQDLVLALDGSIGRWWSPAELAALDSERPFDLDEHVGVFVESVERKPGVGHLTRTRGLGKFARPDVCGRAPRRQAEWLSELLRDLARLLAEGEVVLPGDRLHVASVPPVTLIPRSENCLEDAPPAEAPLYELRDLDADGRPGPDCAALLAALKPKPRLKVIR